MDNFWIVPLLHSVSTIAHTGKQSKDKTIMFCANSLVSNSKVLVRMHISRSKVKVLFLYHVEVECVLQVHEHERTMQLQSITESIKCINYIWCNIQRISLLLCKTQYCIAMDTLEMTCVDYTVLHYCIVM